MSNHRSVRKTVLVALLTVVYLCIPGLCPAENFVTPGSYFIIHGLTGFDDFQDTGVDDFKEAWGLGLRLGYRLNELWALEGDFGSMTGFDAKVDISKFNPNYSGTEKITVDTWSLTVNLKAHLPFGRFDPYAMVGAGVMNANIRTAYPTGFACWPGYYGWYCRNVYSKIDDATEFVIKAGVGTDIHLNNRLAVSLELSYVRPYSDLSDLRYTAFSWGFRFAF